MPKLVYINLSTLKTLSERQYHSGLGEVIKHGLIRDREYLSWIEENKKAIADRQIEALAHMVEESCKVKRAVVEEDPKENGVRALLNFGHTLGHSIEKISGFSLTHGECVALGSLLAVKISYRRGNISEAEYEEIKALYAYFEFPSMPEEINPEEVVKETKYDKKTEHGKVRFILLNQVGEAAIYTDVTQEEMLEAFMIREEK